MGGGNLLLVWPLFYICGEDCYIGSLEESEAVFEQYNNSVEWLNSNVDNKAKCGR